MTNQDRTVEIMLHDEIFNVCCHGLVVVNFVVRRVTMISQVLAEMSKLVLESGRASANNSINNCIQVSS